MKIRRARKRDLKEIGQLYADVFKGIGEDWNDRLAIDFVRKLYHIQKDLFFVVEDRNDGIVGGVWGEIVWHGTEKYLDRIEIWVDRDYQKKGLSKQLLEEVIGTALRKYKISSVCLLADSEKKFPMEYYKKIGFEECTWVNMVGEPEEILKRLK